MKLNPINATLAASLFCLFSSGFFKAQAALVHEYDLNGTYTDSFSGPSLVPFGGTLNATNYAFGTNQGLSLSSALPSNSDYSILVDFSFSTLTGYRKIIDFKNLTSDTGLYNLNTNLNFFNITTGPAGAFVPNTLARLVITRDGSTNLFTGYVNGISQLSFTDSGTLGTFTGLNSIIHFFIDDAVTGGEASAGLVDRIAIYDAPLAAADVIALGSPLSAIPEPSSAAAALGLISLSIASRRRRS